MCAKAKAGRVERGTVCDAFDAPQFIDDVGASLRGCGLPVGVGGGPGVGDDEDGVCCWRGVRGAGDEVGAEGRQGERAGPDGGLRGRRGREHED